MEIEAVLQAYVLNIHVIRANIAILSFEINVPKKDVFFFSFLRVCANIRFRQTTEVVAVD